MIKILDKSGLKGLKLDGFTIKTAELLEHIAGFAVTFKKKQPPRIISIAKAHQMQELHGKKK